MTTPAFPVLLGAIVLDSTNNAIRMKENTTLGGTGLATVSLATSPTPLFLRGDGASDDFCKVLKTALDSHGNTTSPNTYTVIVAFDTNAQNPTATVTITAAGGSSFELLFADPLTTFDSTLIGYPKTNTAFATSISPSSLSPTCAWCCNNMYRKLEPKGSLLRKRSRARSGKVRVVQRTNENRDRLWIQDYIHEKRMHEEAIPTDVARALNRFLARHADGKRFEFHDGTISSGTVLGALSSSTLEGIFLFDDDFYPNESGNLATREDGVPLYSLQGHLLKYVA